LWGKGEKKMLNGNNYIGEFKNGLKDGKGREDTDDHVYEGEYKMDQKDGRGELIYKLSSDFYKGEFRGGLITGDGIYKWSNEDTYEGTFFDGKMHGRGIYRWPDGSEYVGDYINNIKEGIGTFKWSTGRIFIGPFVQGKPHGVGKLTKDGKTIECEFLNGAINRNYKKAKRRESELDLENF
jgi:hypothetical protein